MSFLKKHWRVTVPAVVVLSLLLLGVFTLYTTSEPPQPETVYAMPERSADNPPPLNTGGVSIPSSTTPAAQLVSNPPHGDAAHEGLQTASVERTAPIAAVQESTGHNSEAIETCCPDDINTTEPLSSPQDAAFKAGLTAEEWWNAVQKHVDKEETHNAAVEEQGDRFLELLQQIIAKVPTEKRDALRAEVESKMSLQDREYSREFWESLPQTSDKTMDEVQQDLQNFIVIFKAMKEEQQSLAHDADQLFEQ